MERILSAGYTTLERIFDGSVSVEELFEAHLMLDLVELRHARAAERERAARVRNR